MLSRPLPRVCRPVAAKQTEDFAPAKLGKDIVLIKVQLSPLQLSKKPGIRFFQGERGELTKPAQSEKTGESGISRPGVTRIMTDDDMRLVQDLAIAADGRLQRLVELLLKERGLLF